MFNNLRRLIKTWKPTLYEIPGLQPKVFLPSSAEDWFPKTRFMVKYRRGYYILDKDDGEWVWKRPSMCGTLAVDNYKTPTDRLKMLVMTGLSLDKEVKRIKKLKYRNIPIIRGYDSLLWKWEIVGP